MTNTTRNTKRIDTKRFSELLSQSLAAPWDGHIHAASSLLSAQIQYADRPRVETTHVHPQLAECAHLVWQQSESDNAAIYLGPVQAARVSNDELAAANIKAIVNCTRSTSVHNNNNNKEVKVCQVPISDIESAHILPYLPGATAFIHHQLVLRGHAVLVHCAFGVSRSATVVLAYLMRYHNFSLVDAYRHVKRCRPCIAPNAGFWAQLKSWERSCCSSNDSPIAIAHHVPSRNSVDAEWAGASLALFITLHAIDGMDYKDVCFGICRQEEHAANHDKILYVALDYVWGQGAADFAVLWLVELGTYMMEDTATTNIISVSEHILNLLDDPYSEFAQSWQGEIYPQWVEKVRQAFISRRETPAALPPLMDFRSDYI